MKLREKAVDIPAKIGDCISLEPEEAVQLYTITRKLIEEMVFVSFPGDEKSSGGCILFEKRAQVENIINA